MYLFGVDVPLVEVMFAFTVIAMIILIEITIILIMLSYQIKASKKLGKNIRRLSYTLLKLEDKELAELDKLGRLEEKERSIIESLAKRIRKKSKK